MGRRMPKLPIRRDTDIERTWARTRLYRVLCEVGGSWACRGGRFRGLKHRYFLQPRRTPGTPRIGRRWAPRAPDIVALF